MFKCKGIEFCRPILTKAPRRQRIQSDPVLQTNRFIYYNITNENVGSFNTFLNIALEIVLQNCTNIVRQVSICGLSEDETEGILLKSTKLILATKPCVSADYMKTNLSKISGKYQLILVENNILLNDFPITEYLLADGGFVICNSSSLECINRPLNIISQRIVDGEKYYLLRNCFDVIDKSITVEVKNSELNWINEIKTHLLDNEIKVVYLVSQNEDFSGILGLVNCLNKEPLNCEFRMIFTDDKCGSFSIQDDFYKEQLSKNLVFNIARNRMWGTYIYEPLKEIVKKDVLSANIDIGNMGKLSTLSWVESSPMYQK